MLVYALMFITKLEKIPHMRYHRNPWQESPAPEALAIYNI